MDYYVLRKGMTKVAVVTTLAFIGTLFLSACGQKKESKPTSKSAQAPATSAQASASPTSVTAESSDSADSNLEFYTERYLSPEERLKRRQARLEDDLASQ